LREVRSTAIARPTGYEGEVDDERVYESSNPGRVGDSYRNEEPTPARMIAVYTPAGMEGWFREVCTPVEDPGAAPPPVTDELIRRMLDAGPRHNIEWVD
jgi:hypothetical protein